MAKRWVFWGDARIQQAACADSKVGMGTVGHFWTSPVEGEEVSVRNIFVALEYISVY